LTIRHFENRSYTMSYLGRNRFLGGGPHGKNDVLFKIFLGSLGLIILGFVHILVTKQGRETWLVVSGTMPFYIITSAILIGGIYWWYSHEEFTGSELVFFSSIAIPCSYVTLALAFLWFTNLGHIVIWNSSVREVTWEEAWVDEADDEDDTDTHHSASYDITTMAKESIPTTKAVWFAYVERFGGQGRVNSRTNIWADDEDWGSGSDGDGTAEIHSITWDGKKESKIPTSNEHIEANYLIAADTSLKIQGVKEGYADYLVPYPRVTTGTYGPVYFDRIIEQKAKVGGGFDQLVDKKLDEALQTLGSQKQCNIVVYIVGTADIGFFQALREHWQEGKKNDICVCIGYTQKKINWCRVMAYTDHTEFKRTLECEVRDLETLEGKEGTFVDTILKRIKAPGDKGYLRKPMADFEFLASDVKMPWYIQFLAFAWAGVWLLPTVAICIRD
jgi:hypothetical protein